MRKLFVAALPAWVLSLAAIVTAGGCGSTEGGPNGGSGGGSLGPTGKPSGAPCGSNGECASARCGGGICATPDSGSAPISTPGPQFPGSGGSYRPLIPGCGQVTAAECTGSCEQQGGVPTTVIRPPATLCFSGSLDPTPETPTAVIEQVIEQVNGRSVVHLRVTFDPSFVDNTYGAGACCGWPEAGDAPDGKAGKAGKSGHTFSDLVGSDHVELLLTDGAGNTVMDFKLDYISEDSSSPCGYRTLGVSGGEGKVIAGDANAILGVATSIDRNLNGCGYCLTTDSPATDASYTANPATPNWDYRVVYEVWIDLASFGASGFGQAYINNVHASPSKLSNNTVEVQPTPCPPEWDTPYCPPSVIQEGRNCFDQGGECPPNQALYVASEGRSWCTPIPFSNYPGMAPCPAGYALDAASEGRYCLPTNAR